MHHSVSHRNMNRIQPSTTTPAVRALPVPALCAPPRENISPASVRTMTIRNTCAKLATNSTGERSMMVNSFLDMATSVLSHAVGPVRSLELELECAIGAFIGLTPFRDTYR